MSPVLFADIMLAHMVLSRLEPRRRKTVALVIGRVEYRNVQFVYFVYDIYGTYCGDMQST